jgi:hypothetical protein
MAAYTGGLSFAQGKESADKQKIFLSVESTTDFDKDHLEGYQKSIVSFWSKLITTSNCVKVSVSQINRGNRQ